MATDGIDISIRTYVDQHASLSRLWMTARDYLRGDRLKRRVGFSPDRVAAQLNGFQDRYIPHCARNPSGLQVHCTCGRPSLCAHVAALLLDYVDHQDWYRPIPFQLALKPTTAWPWIVGDAFPWQDIPELPAPYQYGWSPDHLEAGLKPWRSLALPTRVVEDKAYLALGDVHPSWVNEEAWRSTFDSWLERRLVRGSQFSDWLKLLSWAPFLPLDMAFAHFPLSDLAVRRAIFEALAGPGFFGHDTPDRRLALLTLYTRTDASDVEALWQLYQTDDPGFLTESDAFYRAGHTAVALRLLEQGLPENATERHPYRMRFIDWLDETSAIPHRIADALETGLLGSVEPLRATLTVEDWERLTRAVVHRHGTGDGSTVPSP